MKRRNKTLKPAGRTSFKGTTAYPYPKCRGMLLLSECSWFVLSFIIFFIFALVSAKAEAKTNCEVSPFCNNGWYTRLLSACDYGHSPEQECSGECELSNPGDPKSNCYECMNDDGIINLSCTDWCGVYPCNILNGTCIAKSSDGGKSVQKCICEGHNGAKCYDCERLGGSCIPGTEDQCPTARCQTFSADELINIYTDFDGSELPCNTTVQIDVDPGMGAMVWYSGPCVSPDLFVDLKVATDASSWQDSLSGSEPLDGVDVMANVSGTATGTINYKFDCDFDPSDPASFCFSDGDHSDCDVVYDNVDLHTIPAGWHQRRDENDKNFWVKKIGSTGFAIRDVCNYASEGDYIVKVLVQRDSALSAEDTVDIDVTPNPDFNISANPAYILAPQSGSSETSVITIQSVNGFNSSVDLSVSGLPGGASGNFDPHPVTPPAGGSVDSNFSVDVSAVEARVYPLTIMGVGGGISKTVDIDLEVVDLYVNLSGDPDSGMAPLNDVDLTAAVSGTATGTINYKFDCDISPITGGGDCTADGVFNDCDKEWDGESNETYTAVDLCNYSSPGAYSAKVLVQRNMANWASATVRIEVSANNPPQAMISCESSCTFGCPSSCTIYNYDSDSLLLRNDSIDDKDIETSKWIIDPMGGLDWDNPDEQCPGKCDYPIHGFLSLGSHVAHLRVEDAGLLSDEVQQGFEIWKGIEVDFKCSLSDGGPYVDCALIEPRIGEYLYLDDEGSSASQEASLSTWNWELDGVSVCSTDRCSFRINKGDPEVKLTVHDTEGHYDFVTKTIGTRLSLPFWKEINPF